MPKATYIEHDGSQFDVEINDGWTLMQGATMNGIDGIEGECGGSCACATCHCYVEESFMALLPEVGELEDEMLDCAVSERKPNSRLACQIKMTPALDGIVIRLPEAQS